MAKRKPKKDDEDLVQQRLPLIWPDDVEDGDAGAAVLDRPELEEAEQLEEEEEEETEEVEPVDEVVDVIAKININDESCSNHFIQYGAIAGLEGDQTEVKANLETLRIRRNAAVDALNDIEGVECFRPDATFYLFPNGTAVIRRKGIGR